MAWSITLNGTTYTDADMAGYGYITKLPAMLADAVLDLAGKVTAAGNHVTSALGYASQAALSAVTAVNAPGTSGTSASSLTIGVGSKTLSTQPGKAWSVGQQVVIADTAAPATNVMFGAITAYDIATGSMTVSIAKVKGAGVIAAWTIGLSGAVGETLYNKKVAVAGTNIDLSLGDIYTKTITGITTLTVSNAPAAGDAACIVVELTNGGAYAITWWAGVKWAVGTTPTLTASGRDVLGFYTHDGGTTWTGLVLAKDVR